ncbi:MAG TPA: hypothetical protein VF826_19130 [Chloroflexia bacterium]|jgi:hypothetical protein
MQAIAANLDETEYVAEVEVGLAPEMDEGTGTTARGLPRWIVPGGEGAGVLHEVIPKTKIEDTGT